MHAKKIAVMFACSEAFAPALYVTLKTFFEKSPRLASAADIFVYAAGWTEKTKQIISSCGPMQILDYDFPPDIERLPNILRFSPALYARFEGFKLLEQYERVISLDSDILIQRELFPVLQQTKDGIGIILDSLPYIQQNFTEPIPGYDMNAVCYNTGFLVLDNSLPVAGGRLAQWLYGMLKKYTKYLELGDQGLINLVFQEFNLKPVLLSNLWNLSASNPRRALKKAYIIHSTGHRKFWCYYYFDDFYRHYSSWCVAGGNPLSVRKDSVLWSKLLQKGRLQNTVFFQLAPDGFKYPIKFLVFCVKRLLRIQY